MQAAVENGYVYMYDLKKWHMMQLQIFFSLNRDGAITIIKQVTADKYTVVQTLVT